MVDESPFVTSDPHWTPQELEEAGATLTAQQVLDTVGALRGKEAEQVTRQVMDGMVTRHATSETLSTLVHEMTHLEQHHFGQPSRNGYHNKQWAELMKRVGLFPSDTAQPGGKETGQRVSHYIVPGGPFDIACAELLNEGVSLDYVEMWSGPMKGKKLAKPRPLVRPNTPAQPAAFNAWAKPDVLLVCGECQEELQAED